MSENNKFAEAFIKAQQEMTNATKDSTNPHFKSKYADLTAVRDACVPALNKNDIAVLQPIVQKEGKQYIETILIHKSGEKMSCLTEVISEKTTAQAIGSGITYARRYGLQSLVCIGAEDDDGNSASEEAKNNIKLSKEQIARIENLCKQKDFDITKICNVYKVNKIDDISTSKFAQIITTLNAKPDVVKEEVANANN